MTPHLILTNARILTMDATRPRAGAIALAGERILALGAPSMIEPMAGQGTEVIDCKGATLLPGFVESHLHLIFGGAELSHLHLTGIEGEEALTRAHDDEKQGYLQSYDMLGEAAVTAADAGRHYRSYAEAIAAVGRASGGRRPFAGPGISIKLSALHPPFEYAQRDRVM